MDKKIFLLADDDIDDREMFCEALSSIDNDIVCHTVTDGREALETLGSMDTLPRLIFLDVNMPVMNGWECLEKLKRDERHSDIPVIIISTSSSPRELNIAKDLGALCYFIKPHTYTELMQVLRTIVAHLGPSLATALRQLSDNGVRYVHTFV